MNTVKIRLNRNIAVSADHGLVRGRIMDARRSTVPTGRGQWWVQSDAGARVLIFDTEARETAS